MIRNLSFSTVLTVIMLAIFSTMVVVATNYPPGASFMPFVVGIPGIVLCLLQLLIDYLAHHRNRLTGHFHSAPRAGLHHLDEFPTAEKTEEQEPAEPEFGPETVPAEARIWAYFLGFMVAVLLFGFVASVPVLVTLYLWRDAKVRFPFALLSGVICTTVMWAMFEELLQFQLHPGFLMPQILAALGL